jgi:hypothetical protein
LIVVGDLAAGAHDRAEQLLSEGPPFDPEALGLERHSVYLTADEVIFVFEAPDVDRIATQLLDDPALGPAAGRWDKLVEGLPKIAYECFSWPAD